METKKVLSLIFSIIFVCAFGFVLSWGIINFNKVKDGMSGTELYTKEDLNNAYNDGYDTALEDKDEYIELINSYRDTITTLNDNISQLNSQINILTNNNKDYANQVTNLESQKSNLQSQVNNLTTIKSNNEETITQLNSQIIALQKEVAELEKDNDNKDTTIEQKNSQIASLQLTVSQLQRTNELNNETIISLNNQIASLNSQISDMTMQIQNNSSNVSALNNKIAELEKSVSYYEQYIANLENGEQVVATFEFNGSVYNIQIVNKNDTVSVINPTSTDYVIFNYWTVNGEQIDLSTYKITTNTKIVANVTLKYDVKFMVDNEEYNNQIVVKNGYATLPTNPTKDGYEFDGWTTNGVDIVSNINITMVTQNVTYVAKFTKIHMVTFIADGETVNTQKVRNGGYATLPTNPTKDGYEFDGWTTNGVDIISNINTTAVIQNITYIAKFELKSGLFETGTKTRIKSWDELISDGDIVIDNNSIVCANKNLAGDLIIPNVNGITDMSSMFSNCKSLTSIDLSNFDTSNVTDMSFMFSSCESLTSIDLSNFDTSNVTRMIYMFAFCENLTSIDLSNFDTSNVTIMGYMFSNCKSLTSIDLSNFDTSNVTNMASMFLSCVSLTSIDLSNFDTSNVTIMSSVFAFCENLTSIDLSNFDTRNVESYNNMYFDCNKLKSVIVGENYTLDNLPV